MIATQFLNKGFEKDSEMPPSVLLADILFCEACALFTFAYVQERGMKVACAFEMVYNRDPDSQEEPACFGVVKRDDDSCVSMDAQIGEQGAQGHVAMGDLGDSQGWGRFHASLKISGYYRGEMEGSSLYKQLSSQARKYFEDLKT